MSWEGMMSSIYREGPKAELSELNLTKNKLTPKERTKDNVRTQVKEICSDLGRLFSQDHRRKFLSETEFHSKVITSDSQEEEDFDDYIKFFIECVRPTKTNSVMQQLLGHIGGCHVDSAIIQLDKIDKNLSKELITKAMLSAKTEKEELILIPTLIETLGSDFKAWDDLFKDMKKENQVIVAFNIEAAFTILATQSPSAEERLNDSTSYVCFKDACLNNNISIMQS